ncbi:MAG: glucan biosynthesis protein G [Pseudomonadota bacterium]
MTGIGRRAFLAGSAAATALMATGARAADGRVMFRREDVVVRAEMMSAKRYMPAPAVPEDWINLSYDLYKSIWFDPRNALWEDSNRPYSVDFFHPGLYFPRPVGIHEVEGGYARRVPFDLSLFDKTDKVPDLTIDDTLGYSGFRLRTELDEPGVRNEFCVFQGASYFRAIGAGEFYGLSARGLALKTADPRGEEFPEFSEFWLEAPAPGQKNFVLHALLDSPSVTGAYKFTITPGLTCEMEVEATLFPRVPLDHVGLGPLTSMFMFDETNRSRFDDFRPAVHDNDGLMVRNGAGETIWRPLANPKKLQISAFSDENPKGFGLMQRSRKFSDFADLEALYHKRPGLWITPREDWGKGAVALVEIPTDKEIYDNIVAFWRPSEVLHPGNRYDFRYHMAWGDTPHPEVEVPRVMNTRLGKREAGGYIVTIDYEPHPLHEDGPESLAVYTQSPHAPVSNGVLQRNPETGGLRLAFRFEPDEETQLVELRAQLRRDGALASEVWLYRWTA